MAAEVRECVQSIRFRVAPAVRDTLDSSYKERGMLDLFCERCRQPNKLAGDRVSVRLISTKTGRIISPENVTGRYN